MAVSDWAIRRVDELHGTQVPIQRREWLSALAYALALLWINTYVCRDLFRNPTAYMNSMHGFWIALAKHAGSNWLQLNWWPYWGCGLPFQFTYAPLIPVLIAAWTAVTGVSHILAFQSIAGVVYCLSPLTLFAMAWLLMRAPGYAFAAALCYSLLSPTQLIVPDAAFSWSSLWDARRLYLLAVWDDLPHLAALSLLPVAILFLVASLDRRRLRWYIPTVVLIALMALASEFGPVEIIMAAICLLFVFHREALWRNIAITLALGACAYAVVLPFLSPSLLLAISRASQDGRERGFNVGSFTALAIVVVGWVILSQYLPRWTTDWKLQFLVYFAYLTASVPILAQYLHRQFLPQPTRYKAEMEMALALLLVFGLRPWLQHVRFPLKVAIGFLLLALAAEQIVSHRHYAKAILVQRDITQTIEYRTAMQVQLLGTRVMLPGSIAPWANAFTDVSQFSGAAWSEAMNPVQQLGVDAVYNGGATAEEDARVSLVWLRAFGVGGIAISGPNSQEYWKPYAHPNKFDGLLPVLWRADDVTIYQVPQRSASLAHVVPAAAIVTHPPAVASDVAEIEAYGQALDDRSLPVADMRWDGTNRMFVRANISNGQAVSVQISYHPGWHARANGHTVPLRADGLGLMWLAPDCQGSCELELDYDGGWELRLSRYISFAALAMLVLLPLGLALLRRQRRL
ncbi:MAG TPA: hypothetical protein VK686_00840 [Bryobacteraceae bacterium]|nr:hypothetical protein [Bryobacteraceae bacterium]